MVGKGGVGKTTTAALLALRWARAGPVHLVSTDPAHSLGDVFSLDIPAGAARSACTPALTVEQPDAEARAQRWLDRVRTPLTDLLERGSYLDAEDIAAFTALRLPGIDEVMAALRLVELLDSEAPHVVVDTAPTGHTLRLLDAHLLLQSWTALLDALAAKADTVAAALLGRAVRSAGRELRDELHGELERFRTGVLAAADFILVGREGEAVRAETARLGAALAARGLRVRAWVHAGPGAPPADALLLPWRPAPPRGCTELEAALDAVAQSGPAEPDVASGAAAVPARRGSAERWLEGRPQRLLMFAGKGGVGKSTCAAAAAVVLARTRPVLLMSADPAGSLGEVLGCEVGGEPGVVAPRLRAVQLDAAAALARWRGEVRAETEPLLEKLGLVGNPALDRAVFDAVWNLAPPGMDELVALAELMDAAEEGETVVLDTAPTGHFLRLMALPELATEWTRAVMRIMLKYGVGGELDAVARRVVAFARQLRELRSRLADAGWAGTIIVTLMEPMVEAETQRLVASLASAGIPLAALLTNRHDARSPTFTAAPAPSLTAPLLGSPPSGVDALSHFAALWELQ